MIFSVTADKPGRQRRQWALRPGDQEIDDVVAQLVVAVQVVQLRARALARQRVDHHLGHATGLVALSVSLPLVISRMRSASRMASSTSWVIMNTVWCVAPTMLHQLVLDDPARERIQRPERLVQQQHLGLDRERTGNAHALLHAAGQLGRLLVDGAVEAHHPVLRTLCSRIFAPCSSSASAT
jgi:hypothetical protein